MFYRKHHVPIALGVYCYQSLFYVVAIFRDGQILFENTYKSLIDLKRLYPKTLFVSALSYTSLLSLELRFNTYKSKKNILWWQSYLENLGYEAKHMDIFYQGLEDDKHLWQIYVLPADTYALFMQRFGIELDIIDIDFMAVWRYYFHQFPSAQIRELSVSQSHSKHYLYGRGADIWQVTVQGRPNVIESYHIDSPWIFARALAFRGLWHAI
jgi:hypothetical protein